MMLLGLETATTAAAVALVGGPDVPDRVATTERRHTETLLPAVVSILDAAGLGVKDLGGVVVDIGPGLFTGLRVGVATARSLAAAAGIPLFSVTSLEVLAADPTTPEDGTVLSIIDARRGEVFVEAFSGPRRSRTSLGPPIVCRPEGLARVLAGLPGGTVVVGDGAVRYRDEVAALGSLEMASGVAFPSPSVACRLVIDEGRRARRVDEVVPLYLRDPDAIANFTVARGRQAT